MAFYYYIARDKEGKKITGIEEALEEDELLSRLQSKELLVTKIKPVEKKIPSLRKFSHRRIKSYDLILFARQLSTLIGSGVTLLRSLEVILLQVDSQRLYRVLEDIKKRIESGENFREALSHHPKVFSELWINLVETGEASGNLPIVLEQLANYLEQKAEFKRKIISATIYPVILFLVAVGAIFFFVIFIIPKFTELFSGFGIELPVLTRIMVSSSEFIRRRFLIGVIGFIGLFFILRLIIRTPQGRKRFDQLKFKLPILGKFFKTLLTERLTSEISTLIESGVPILYALEITERSIGNRVVEEIIRDVKSNVREGRSFAKPLEESGFFPPMVVQMVSIGEEIGEVSKMLKRVSSFYAKAIETFISRMTAMFEPLMLIFMGAIIGTIVISMFLPIFQIATVGAK